MDQYDDQHDLDYHNPENGYDDADENGYDGYDGYDNVDDGPHSPAYNDADDDDNQEQLPPHEPSADDVDRPDMNDDPRHVFKVYEDETGAMVDQDDSVITEYFKSKDPEWGHSAQREKIKNLLDLPIDILHLIVGEITHTNDLTSLALTNSTFYNLAIPLIYSRFDIVWPDALINSTETKSVDALTYGLSTLCLGSSFARTTRRFRNIGNQYPEFMPKLGNYDYAKHTRKFSLGNGPNDWVAEYMINKESGKMLGTLVALAVSKMVNLESFVWDMPTGVISDIFMALASLPEKTENGEHKLERVWIRWHDNTETGATSSSSSPGSAATPAAVVPAGSTLTPVGISLPSTVAHPAPRPPITYSENHVEYPTFSVLPPLKSLTVLDIDEPAYLDEMSVLIERSKNSLRDLKVGLSFKVAHKDFVQTWDGPELQQVDHSAGWPGESTIGERRLGGILGVLVGRLYDIRRKLPKTKPVPSSADPGDAPSQQNPQTTEFATPFLSPNGVPPQSGGQSSPSLSVGAQTPMLDTTSTLKTPGTSGPANTARKRLDGKLTLTTLELERVPLSMQVCAKAFDWTVLTNLTILECAQHENLWKLLKKQFEPKPQESGFGISPISSRPVPNAPLQYKLNLKRIHTDMTSQALITFIKETLEPNSLEVLFLQDRRRGSGAAGSASNVAPPVTLDSIFKGAIKRHRGSLRKLLLDSSAKTQSTGTNSESTRWRSWCLTSEILQYITSGRMTKLKELAVSIDYKDWHTFLQRLPNIPQLRSLHIPYLADHVIGNFEPKELVMQITDIITLRPEIQLCYVGISTKCFEILETRPSEVPGTGLINGNSGPANPVNGDADVNHAPAMVEDATDDDENDTEDEDHDDEDDSEDEGTPTSPTDPNETQSELSDDAESDDDSFIEPAVKTRLRLREILFYDDKVAIFKARHGQL